jgi:hypothetical protein
MTLTVSPRVMADGTICRTGPSCKRHNFAQNNSLTSRISQQLVQARKAVSEKNQSLPFPEGNKRVGKNISDPDWAKKLYIESNEIETKLTDQESGSLGWYRMGGYGQVNALLRNGREGHRKTYEKEFNRPNASNKEVEEYYDNVKNHVKNIDQALKHERTFNEPTLVYRGVRIEEQIPEGTTVLQYVKNKYKVGDTITEKGYVSTSADSDYMSFFGRKRVKAKGPHVVYEIIAKKGLPVFEANRTSKPYQPQDGNIQTFEREILLNRDSKFRVVGVKNVSFQHSYDEHLRGWGSFVNDCPNKVSYPVVQLEQII